MTQFNMGEEIMRKCFISPCDAEQLFKKTISNKNTTPTIVLAFVGDRVQTQSSLHKPGFCISAFPPALSSTLKTSIKERDSPPFSLDIQ